MTDYATLRFQSLNRDKGRSNKRRHWSGRRAGDWFQSLNRDKGRSNRPHTTHKRPRLARFNPSIGTKDVQTAAEKEFCLRLGGVSIPQSGQRTFKRAPKLELVAWTNVSIPQSGQRTFKRARERERAGGGKGFNPSIGTKDVQTASDGERVGGCSGFNPSIGTKDVQTPCWDGNGTGVLGFQSLNRDKGRSNSGEEWRRV